ncbi:RNA polymerase sigma-70 factor (ECF subfamily) [Kibdelosporangium banguiense]|uniref:RNA polymerase sigma-70 factor (ECF subfamily) n=1 Tax=Kibdelosporangium banguiense TaxID=1365924 RepID=A0ABS4T7A5_9PSEU|nr:sigma-70 family RNA polymerase sigma factor [Kibdelosporangium banguiense]MBP2320283.1 RNA polymerase sigma-70 factor (ECF subfamily) [Kibdelosporangium banguiense]
MPTQRPGHRVLQRIIAEPDLRFRATVDGYAHRYTLDRDDLYQAASERLLRQGNVEPDHEGLRGWLDRCVNYAALDMIKERNRQPVLMSELPERATSTPQESVGWEQWLTTLLAATLSPDQVRAVVELARDPDLDLRELAKIVDKSYAGARQLKSRAMAKLGRLIGLTSDERAAYRAWRRDEGPAEVARRLGIDPAQVDRLRRAASVKLRRFLSRDATGSRRQGRA